MNFNIPEYEPVFPIRTAAKLLNISVHTLRMYEREGLILPHKKSSGQRLYSQKDIERIECIRKSINKDKLSIKGILKIFSFIPCWKIVGCTEEDRFSCKAYNGDSIPCWTVNHVSNACEGRDCRSCEVYLNYGECHRIKEKLKELIKP